MTQMEKKEEEKIIKVYEILPEGIEKIDSTETLGFENNEISNLVENRALTRIVVKDGHLIQKIYPIFKDPTPSNIFDFRDQFFSSTKYFAGLYFDTFYFNVVMIWLMSILLYATLYFDGLKRIVRLISRENRPN